MTSSIRRGFSLIEMLAVVGTMMLLIGLAIPTVTKVRLAAQRSTCASQIRALLQAHHGYMADHRGWMIDVGLPHGGLVHEDAWFFTLQPYYDNALVLRSPVDQSPFWGYDTTGDGEPDSGTTIPGTNRYRVTSYGVNDFLTSQNPEQAWLGEDAPMYRRFSQVSNPTNTINFLMMTFGCIDPPHGCSPVANEFAGTDHVHPYDWIYTDSPEVAVESYIQTNAHGGPRRSWDSKANYGFLDGHVARHRFAEVVMPGTEDLDGAQAPLAPEVNRLHPRAAVRFANLQYHNSH